MEYNCDLDTKPDFGFGFDSRTGRFPQQTPYEEPDSTASFVIPTGVADQLEATVLTESYKSSEARHFDIKLALRYFSFGADASYANDALTSTNHNEVTWIVTNTRNHGKWVRKGPLNLTDAADRVKGDPFAFISRYGDEYVSAYHMSSRVELTYTYAFDAVVDNSTMSAAARAFVNAFQGCSSVDTHISDTLKTARESGRLKISVKSNGSSVDADPSALLEVDPLDVAKLRPALHKYLLQAVVNGSPSPHSFETAPHLALVNSDGGALQPAPQIMRNAFNRISWSMNQSDVATLLLSKYNLSDAQRANVTNAQKAIDHAMDDLRTALSSYFTAKTPQDQIAARDRVNDICNTQQVPIPLPPRPMLTNVTFASAAPHDGNCMFLQGVQFVVDNMKLVEKLEVVLFDSSGEHSILSIGFSGEEIAPFSYIMTVIVDYSLQIHIHDKFGRTRKVAFFKRWLSPTPPPYPWAFSSQAELMQQQLKDDA